MPKKSKFIEMRENEREARKGILIDTAIELFGEKPYHEVGMRTIAEAAGVSPASIYRYFPSREDLLVEALMRDLEDVGPMISKRLDQGDLDLEVFAVAAIDYLIENESTFQMMCHFMIRGEMNKPALDKFNGLMRTFLMMIEESLKKAGYTEVDRFFAHAFTASIFGIVMTYRNYPGRSKAERRKYMHKIAGLLCVKLLA